ncbi:hypothetical protein SULI_05095 [Saccharolobus solfataricus]|uniref:Uncharacterized protein n=3 Tax=Saccharolobus solfataricus TaxID=2287 RepID=Q981C5_SACS2|nr:hypothetical protein [Saccharolobus solfataricus]AAK40387.1 Hypothetical protein SSO0020 [Saccharolobus solfataricus P2]AKA73380.1 hypothetical protein SULB_1039 [Saccharolobus solfataricus]AKA76079.1 hypothetical protein SULC_1038 [Saccharolobus solfataricus]AKA78772.1 hypothetical protein SULA_1037 [Saccharolobus solfataricus]AZF67848.1 hypothetical protein SULG_05095 [Saccharolobus solfataricus]
MIVEGYFLKYRDVIWSIKGCYHPDGYAVAIPRLFNGVKIKRLNDALEVVRTKFSNLLKYVDEIGFNVPLVPLNESEILDPFNAKIFNNRVREFLRFFNGDVGITGSYLYLGKGNDMDFLSFKPEHYYVLEELRKKGITKPLSTVEESEIETLDYSSFKILKSKRILEGIFEGRGYTFKIVQCEKFGPVREVKEFEGYVRILKSIKPFTIPVKYLVTDNHGNEYILTSFRTRFTELLPNMEIFIKGKILVRDEFNDMDLDIAEIVKLKSF